jgi:hypothetical protein
MEHDGGQRRLSAWKQEGEKYDENTHRYRHQTRLTQSIDPARHDDNESRRARPRTHPPKGFYDETEGRTGRPVLDLAIDGRRIYKGAGQHRDEIKNRKERGKEGNTKMECRGMQRCSGEGMGKENGYAPDMHAA